MRTPDKLSFTEYKLEYKHGPREGQPRQPCHDEWKDGSGYNNQTGTYYHRHQAKSQITRTRKWLERHGFTNIEFRVLSREVTRTEWAEVDLDASS